MLRNLLTSGFTFTEEECEQYLQYILFNSLLLSNITLILLAGILRFATGNIGQGIVDCAYSGFGAILFITARKSRKAYLTLARCMMLFSILIVALTYKFTLGGLVGSGWFSILIITSFFLLDIRCAYAIFGISLLLVIGISTTSVDPHFTALDIFAAVLPLLATLFFIQFYERRNAHSKKWLRALNAKLDEKVELTSTALSSSEEKFRNLVENINDWVWEMNAEGVYSYSSPASLAMLGYEPHEITGRPHKDFVHPGDLEQSRKLFVEYVNQRKPFSNHLSTARHRHGTPVYLESTGRPIFSSTGVFLGYRGVHRDIGKRLEAQKSETMLKEQLYEAQKMEAMGTLAGGVAHDFNNILSVIQGNAEICKIQLAAGSPARKNIDLLMTAVKRAAGLTGQILAVSRRNKHHRSPLRLDLIVAESTKMLRASLPATIAMQTDIDSESGMVLADPTQMHQIVLNLCTNAVHSMKEDAGQLQIGVRRVELQRSDLVDQPTMEAGPFVVLSVEDNGSGMGKGTLSRIFEPYFTTKAVGEGTGLGLAVTHSIVKDSKGFIRVTSEIDAGTIFEVYLPAIKPENMLPENGENRIEPRPRGTESILVVDDEVDIVLVVKHHFRELGYNVTGCADSLEALKIFLEAPELFDLVITDQTMPHLTGRDLVQAILKCRPDLPVILCTGYAAKFSEKQAHAIGVKQYMYKPVSLERLAKAVRELLDSSGRKSS